MQTVAIIGASSDRTKYGNKALRAFTQKGYKVYPVNPNEAEVEGQKTYAQVQDLPERPNRVTVYVPPRVGLKLLPDIAAKGCDELWLNPGADSEEVVSEAKRLGLNVVQSCSILAIGASPHEL